MKIDIRTLNDAFKTFAAEHKMINSFKNSEFETIFSDNREYPLMWVGYPGFDFRQNAIDQEVNIMFLNNIPDGEDYINVYSDMLLVAEDFHSIFAENDNEFDFLIDTAVTGYPLTTKINSDNVVGVAMTVTAKIHMSRNEMQVPDQ